ncbi:MULTISPECIES: polyprenyl synthetase family protein [Nitrospirillum]|uniref:Octaprenyl diphosphate synthase n=2 Tax=Nitrospirillum TaxID=1543705 RepID=A0A248JTS5_9PROT|nr:polyprenyl synthetase family protein [Nitrospirillum amazonense]ASG22105.1 farnesyltranstransferase [Nitrospirillum amazonense CBAmc]EGY01664.1 octaprenyl-diphosphate synthase [Nitrospirillum amazonense Y2]MEC4593856.1 polyprenyl synthetase family protein [Nitrospirillum amazonense]TWB25817.1 octaprenyl-diphosphate synthase [Nitrospirillum amazonense]TWB32760.1 octaprenyl-diphosphate synthase [Nitrospirillum amazonense]
MAVVTPLDPKRRKAGTDALEALVELVATDLAAVNDLIIRRMHSDVEMIPQLAGYIVASGGKRLRPVLTLAAARLCGYQGERHQPLAACVEFIHTATLLHDDVVDESDLRRGQPSANAVFGNKASVLVGDFLFSRAFQVMTEDGSLDVLRILSSASAVISEGEVLQLITANDTTTSEEAYLEVIRAKTAELFAAACRIGAVVAGRPAAEEEALRSYGLNLGIAFQVVDDVLDYSAVQARLGKSIGDDFREGKITLPVVLAFRRGDDEERAFWRRTLEDIDQRDGDLEHALALMQRHNTLRDSVERARHYGAMARDALGLFPASPIKRALLDVIDFVVDRDF